MSAAASLGVGVVGLGPSGIVMDTSKAMAILGFSPSQTFESTTMPEIHRAFMFKMHLNMGANITKVLISALGCLLFFFNYLSLY